MVKKRYVLSVSYSDYRNSIGGTDKVICAHSEMFNRAGIGYVFIFPLNFFHNYPIKNNPYWGIVEDGEYRGAFHTEGVISYLQSLQENNGMCLSCVHVHHLKNVNIKKLGVILNTVSCDVYFYVHDYYNICVSTNLLRSDNHLFCHGKLDREQCGDCKFYPTSEKHSSRFLALLSNLKTDYYFVCPSGAAKEQFSVGYPQFSDKALVIYHQKFLGSFDGNKNPHTPLRVAFIGSQLSHKGWGQFLQIVEKHSGSGKYDFYYFGKKAVDNDSIKHISVEFKGNLNAISDALREQEIDCAVLWSTWPETYAYTYYEALSANCFIVTNKNSGNIQYQTRNRNNGVVLDSDNELLELFDDSRLLEKMISDYKKQNHCLPLNLLENDDVLNTSEKQSLINCGNNRAENLFKKQMDRLVNGIYRWRSENK